MLAWLLNLALSGTASTVVPPTVPVSNGLVGNQSTGNGIASNQSTGNGIIGNQSTGNGVTGGGSL